MLICEPQLGTRNLTCMDSNISSTQQFISWVIYRFILSFLIASNVLSSLSTMYIPTAWSCSELLELENLPEYKRKSTVHLFKQLAVHI